MSRVSKLTSRTPVTDRLELDKRLRECGANARLFSSDEARDKAAWALKHMRDGHYRHQRLRIDPTELR